MELVNYILLNTSILLAVDKYTRPLASLLLTTAHRELPIAYSEVAHMQQIHVHDELS